MKNFLKYQEVMTIQQKIYYNFCIIKNVINTLVKIYQDKKIQIFLKKLNLKEH